MNTFCNLHFEGVSIYQFHWLAFISEKSSTWKSSTNRDHSCLKQPLTPALSEQLLPQETREPSRTMARSTIYGALYRRIGHNRLGLGVGVATRDHEIEWRLVGFGEVLEMISLKEHVLTVSIRMSKPWATTWSFLTLIVRFSSGFKKYNSFQPSTTHFLHRIFTSDHIILGRSNPSSIERCNCGQWSSTVPEGWPTSSVCVDTHSRWQFANSLVFISRMSARPLVRYHTLQQEASRHLARASWSVMGTWDGVG
jgi:hypothetical protein